MAKGILTKKNMVLLETISAIENCYKNSIGILGKGAMTFPSNTSSNRLAMFGKNIEQFPVQVEPQLPIISTGHENMYAQYSLGLIKSDNDYEIISKISKYPNMPNRVYTLIVKELGKERFHVIEKKQVENLTESFGYKYFSDNMDNKNEHELIEKDETLMHSSSFDEFGNYRYGQNLRTVFLTDPKLEEDGIVMSDKGAEKCKFWKVHPVRFIINENDVLANIYGDKENYKPIPDVGENIKENILAVIKRIDHKKSFFSLKTENLTKINAEDTIISPPSGEIVDINVYCNKPINELTDEVHTHQIYNYARLCNDYMLTIKNTIDALDILDKEDIEVSSDLSYLYNICEKGLDDGHKWGTNYKSSFSHLCIEFTVLEQKKVSIGSKFTGRFGDKGVIVKIVKEEDMPRVKMLRNGKYVLVPVEMCCNSLGINNRLNPAQLFTTEITHISRQLLEYTRTHCKTLGEKRKIIFKYFSIVSPFHADKLLKYFNSLDTKDKVSFIQDIESREYIYTTILPVNNELNLKMLATLQTTFKDIICKEDIYQKNIKGRWIKGETQVMCGVKYTLRLKHDADTKFSARSTGFISSTTSLPMKSNDNKVYKSPYSDTPIKFGRMEWLNMMLDVDGIDSTHDMKMFYSDYVLSRRDESLYTQDPLTIERLPINRDENSRVMEILNTFLMGRLLHLGNIENRYSHLTEDDYKLLTKEDFRFSDK